MNVMLHQNGNRLQFFYRKNETQRLMLMCVKDLENSLMEEDLRGKRIELGYKNRTLSCFKRDDLKPAARGFIREGFKQGLKPHEFLFPKQREEFVLLLDHYYIL